MGSLLAAMCAITALEAATVPGGPPGRGPDDFSVALYQSILSERGHGLGVVECTCVVTARRTAEEREFAELLWQAMLTKAKEDGQAGHAPAKMHVPRDSVHRYRLVLEGAGSWREDRDNVGASRKKRIVSRSFHGGYYCRLAYEGDRATGRETPLETARATPLANPLDGTLMLWGLSLGELLQGAAERGHVLHRRTIGEEPGDVALRLWGKFTHRSQRSADGLQPWVMLFLDSALNYAPVRIETGITAEPPAGSPWRFPVRLATTELDQHVEIRPGIWLPRRIVRRKLKKALWPEVGRPRKEWQVREFVSVVHSLSAEIRPLAALPAEFAVEFPEGTHITEGFTGEEYVAAKGLPPRVMREVDRLSGTLLEEANRALDDRLSDAHSIAKRGPAAPDTQPERSEATARGDGSDPWLVVRTVSLVLAGLAGIWGLLSLHQHIARRQDTGGRDGESQR